MIHVNRFRTATLDPSETSSLAVRTISRMLRPVASDPIVEARRLVADALGVGPIDLILDPDRPLGGVAAGVLAEQIARRLNHEPLSRILGRRGFWTFDLDITPDVLDPRPETELIVETALSLLADRRNQPLRFLDLGTGSGAILCALLAEFPGATGQAVDVSPSACDVARGNLASLGFSSRAEVRCESWETLVTDPVDLVVSNPPYIPTTDVDELDPEVREFDPRLALDGGPDGLMAYRAIIRRLIDWLVPGGLVIMETGACQSGPVGTILSEAGLLTAGVWRDLGGHDRVIAGRYERSDSPDAKRA